VNFEAILYGASVWVLPVLTAITFHEAAHGFVAWRLGDDTAKRLGRVTFNPLRHIDPFGTILLPGMLIVAGSPFLFGYAKPVPVNFRRLRRPRRDMVLVAAAGPVANLIIAFAAALLMYLGAVLPAGADAWWLQNLHNAIVINLVLAVFNMIPLPPLDGGRVAVGLLPRELGMRLARLERYGMLILIGVVFLLPLVSQQLGLRISIGRVIGPPVEFFYDAIMALAGHG
jgi:Zn-dependent protease